MPKIKSNRLFRYFEYKILHIDDSPHKIALGLAIGLFMAWSPLMGLHIILAVALSFLLRANKFSAFVSVWVSNVFTFFIIYYPSYLLGRFILSFFAPAGRLSSQEVLSSLRNLFSFENFIKAFYSADYWKEFWLLSKTIGLELWIGCTIIGSIVAVISYFICVKVIKSHRAKNPHRRYRKFE
ncbi:MAG: DUF2062 domain-containing protein [Phycisphaerales bacterium]